MRKGIFMPKNVEKNSTQLISPAGGPGAEDEEAENLRVLQVRIITHAVVLRALLNVSSFLKRFSLCAWCAMYDVICIRENSTPPPRALETSQSSPFPVRVNSSATPLGH